MFSAVILRARCNWRQCFCLWISLGYQRWLCPSLPVCRVWLIAYPVVLCLDVSSVCSAEIFWPCHNPAIWQELPLYLSTSSSLCTLFLQLSAPAAFLQASQLIPTIFWLVSFLITCAFPNRAIYVSPGSPFLAVLPDSGLNSEFWSCFFSTPLISSEVTQPEFFSSALSFVSLSFALLIILGCMNMDVAQ